MIPRPRLLCVLHSLLLAVALLSGCTGITGGESSSIAEGESSSPTVPALHPEVDDFDETVITITTPAGDEVRVDAKVASMDAQRRRGLMGVEELPDGVGMLFVFDEPRTGGFWMRDTLVPLDIAYVDEEGTVATIMPMEPCPESVEPDAADCATYVPDQPYLTALEVPQGWYAQAGVTTGSTLDWEPPRPPELS